MVLGMISQIPYLYFFCQTDIDFFLLIFARFTTLDEEYVGVLHIESDVNIVKTIQVISK